MTRVVVIGASHMGLVIIRGLRINLPGPTQALRGEGIDVEPRGPVPFPSAVSTVTNTMRPLEIRR